jgi:DnaJ-class molecular chaperone
MDPYAALGLKPQATAAEIKSAYRKLAKQFHPDLNPGNKSAETRFKEINAANELIGTPEARAKYDRGETEEAQRQQYQRSAGAGAGGQQYYYQTQGGPGGGRYSQSFHGMDEDLFSSIFGEKFGGAGGGFGGATGPQDENYQMSIDFKDSILGGEKDITLPGGKRLRVKIPAGIETGKKLRFAGQGQNQADVYVEIEVKPSDVFTRNGNNVEIEIPISVAESLLGAEVRVPTLDGAVMLKVPPQISSGQKLRVTGKGVAGKGDQLVKVKIVNAPASNPVMDEEFKKAVEAWKERHPFSPRPNESQGGV